MKDDPTNIPPIPLKIITASLVMLFVVVPVLASVKSGHVGSLPLLIAAGFTLVVVILGLMFLHRILLWIHYRFYWYITAVIYAILFMLGFVLVVMMTNSNQVAIPDSFPSWATLIFLPGAVIGLVAIFFIFRRGRRSTNNPITTPPAPPSPVLVQPSSPPKQILDTAQQIAARKKNLGVDDKT